jgi:hypothetical protein
VWVIEWKNHGSNRRIWSIHRWATSMRNCWLASSSVLNTLVTACHVSSPPIMPSQKSLEKSCFQCSYKTCTWNSHDDIMRLYTTDIMTSYNTEVAKWKPTTINNCIGIYVSKRSLIDSFPSTETHVMRLAKSCGINLLSSSLFEYCD